MALRPHRASRFKVHRTAALGAPERTSCAFSVVPLPTDKAPLPYERVPRTLQLPFVGSLPSFLKAGGQKHLHEYADRLHQRLGPIFVDKLSGSSLLFLADPDANLEVYRAEGPHPEHFLMDAWTLYLQETQRRRGLFFMDGEEWQRNRHILNKLLLHPKSMDPYVSSVSKVCRELMDVWRNNPPHDHLEYHLYCWNIECIGEISLGKRLGFLEKLRFPHCNRTNSRFAQEDEFVKSIYNTFLESANLYTLPAKLAKSLKLGVWTRFHDAVTKSLDFGRRCVESRIREWRTSDEREIEAKRGILRHLLQNGTASEEDATTLLVDLFLASADTTSHAAAWSLYLLGRNPEVAERARSQIRFHLRGESHLTFQTVSKIPYLRAIVKETLRMYPIASFLTRRLAKDTVLCGYMVPSGTMIISSIYTMGRDPSNFSDPNSFRPERWFRDESERRRLESNGNALNNKAYVPWGLGGRSCIGKRVAELELSLLIMEALLAFDWSVEEEVQMVLRMVAVPSRNVKLKLKMLNN